MNLDDLSLALLDDPSLDGLPAQVCWHYARLLHLAGQCGAGGVLSRLGRPLGLEALAQELEVEVGELTGALQLLQGAGLVAQAEGTWMLPHMMYASAKYNLPLRRYWREKKRQSRSRQAAASAAQTAQALQKSGMNRPQPASDTPTAANIQPTDPESTISANSIGYAQPDSGESGYPTSAPPAALDHSPLNPLPDSLPEANPGGEDGHVKDMSGELSADTSIDMSGDLSAEKSTKTAPKMSQLNKQLINARGDLIVCSTQFSDCADSRPPPTQNLPESPPENAQSDANAPPGNFCADLNPGIPANLSPEDPPLQLLADFSASAASRPADKPAICEPAAQQPSEDPPWDFFADLSSPSVSRLPDEFPTIKFQPSTHSASKSRLKRRTSKPATFQPEASQPLCRSAEHFRFCYPEHSLRPRAVQMLEGLERQYGARRVIEVIDWTVLKNIPLREALHIVYTTCHKWSSPPSSGSGSADGSPGVCEHRPALSPASAAATHAARPASPGGSTTAAAAPDPDELYLLQNPNGPLREVVEERLRKRRGGTQKGDIP